MRLTIRRAVPVRTGLSTSGIQNLAFGFGCLAELLPSSTSATAIPSSFSPSSWNAEQLERRFGFDQDSGRLLAGRIDLTTDLGRFHWNWHERQGCQAYVPGV